MSYLKKTKLIRITKIIKTEIIISLSKTLLLLMSISFKLKSLKKIKINNTKKIVNHQVTKVNTTKVAPKKTKKMPKTWATLSVSKKIITLTSISKSQKTSSSFGNFYINNYQKKREIGINTLYLIFNDLQRAN